MHYVTWSAPEVARLREHTHLSLVQFSRKVGCRPATVWEWEQGRKTASRLSCILLTQVANESGFWPDISGDPRNRYAYDSAPTLQIADR